MKTNIKNIGMFRLLIFRLYEQGIHYIPKIRQVETFGSGCVFIGVSSI